MATVCTSLKRKREDRTLDGKGDQAVHQTGDGDERHSQMLSIAAKFDCFTRALKDLVDATPRHNFSTRGLDREIEERVVVAKVLKRLQSREELTWLDQYARDEVRIHPAETDRPETVSYTGAQPLQPTADEEEEEEGEIVEDATLAGATGAEATGAPNATGADATETIEAIEAMGGYPPLLPIINNKVLQEQVFSHRSHANALAPSTSTKAHLTRLHNERLEFLGDSYLNHWITRLLFRRMPDAREGELSVLRSQLIGNACCNEFAKLYGFERRLLLSSTAERDGVREAPKVVADVFEAYIGGLVLDGSAEIAEGWVCALVAPRLDAYERQQMASQPLDTMAKQRIYNHYGKTKKVASKEKVRVSYTWIGGGCFSPLSPRADQLICVVAGMKVALMWRVRLRVWLLGVAGGRT